MKLGKVEGFDGGELVVGGWQYRDIGFYELLSELFYIGIEENFGIVEALDVGQHGLVDTGVEFA